MPYPASLIAYAFVKKGIDQRRYVTQMQLQKMIYFAHGYHLAVYNQPLILENFEAWKYGPVLPNIYQVFKFYGSDKIIDIGLIQNFHDKFSDLSVLDAKAINAINYTWIVTSGLSAGSLSAWSHKEGAPWAQAYKDGVGSTTIDNDAIKEYFQRLLTSKPNEPTAPAAAS